MSMTTETDVESNNTIDTEVTRSTTNDIEGDSDNDTVGTAVEYHPHTNPSEWTGVIRYVIKPSRFNDEEAVHVKQPILCELCAPLATELSERSIQATDDTSPQPEWYTAQLLTNGSVTVCENPDCPYLKYDGVQIKETITDHKHRDRIGPFRNEQRPRYENSGKVILCGGMGWFDDIEYDYAHPY